MAYKKPADRAPHGTFAAFQRHKREGDTPCDPCVEAARVHRRVQKERQRRAKLDLPPLTDEEMADMTATDDQGDDFTLPSELEEVTANYSAVKRAMDSPATPATALAGLSKQRESLYARLVVLTERAEHARIIREAVEHSDPDLAVTAMRDAGGTALDVLLAQRAARAKPITTVADRSPEDDEA